MPPPDQTTETLNYSRAVEERVSAPSANLTKHTGPPSKVRYGLAVFWGIISDICDVLVDLADVAGALAGAGFGGIAVWAILESAQFVIFTFPISLIIGKKGGKEKENAIESLLKKRSEIEQRILFFRNLYAGTLKVARKIPRLRKPVAQFALKFASMRGRLGKTALGRLSKKLWLDRIPIVSWWPWTTMGIIAMYKQEREAHELIMELVDAVAEGQNEEQQLAA